MIDYRSIFKGKQITQMGLGLLGRGVGDASFLAQQGARLTVTDLKDKDTLQTSLKKLRPYKDINFRLGGHEEDDFKNKDLILKGAGVPLRNTYIDTARKHNVPIDMSASLFARIAGIPIVGVTGTRGKSTVTQLVYEMLHVSGQETLLGGNVKGVSNLQLLLDVTDSSIGVFELDSWQCQGFGEERSLDHPAVIQGPHSPAIAVFTTFMLDHMNYYNGDMDAYVKDKMNIFKYQDSAHVLVIGRQAVPALEAYKKDMRANVIIADETDVPKSWNTKLLGVHNRYNIGVAVATARALGVDDEFIQAVVEKSEPMQGRLARVATVNGVEVYNDTNATTPEAATCALEALDDTEERGLIVIAGGADKGLPQDSFAQAIEAHAKHTVLLPGEGTEVLRKVLTSEKNITLVDSLEEAVSCAFEHAKDGDRIVLSPGCASFGLFTNEYDRGEQFMNEVQKYAK